MSDKTTSITDLPVDILVLVFPFLDARSFLSLCSTCKAFQQSSLRLEPTYWRSITQHTFRFPNQPVDQHDGGRWHNLYRRLCTQNRPYYFGLNDHLGLGYRYDAERQNRDDSFPCWFPTELEESRDLGVIVDMQCG